MNRKECVTRREYAGEVDEDGWVITIQPVACHICLYRMECADEVNEQFRGGELGG